MKLVFADAAYWIALVIPTINGSKPPLLPMKSWGQMPIW
jgi:hypothetical protein